MNLDDITVEQLEADPYPVYAYLRDHEPIAYMPCLDVWMITSWRDVEAACNDPDRFPAHVENSPTDRALGGISMMTTDGEPAKQRRRPFDSTLRPRAVESTMPEVFERLCRDRLDALASADRADLLTDYFEPISVMSLASAIGIDHLVEPETLVSWFAGLAAGVSNYEDDPDKWALCDRVSMEIDEVVRSLFEARLTDPDDGMISNLVHATEGPLDDRVEWAMPSLKLVLLGGLQEPAHGGATIADRLLSNPDQMDAVRSDPSLVPAAVEEGLRWTAPIGNLLRGVAPNTALSGVRFPVGARTILVVSSANRDREIWGADADAFDINRPRRTHLSFATGPHYCIGHHFARRQLQTAIRMLLERFPNMRHDPGTPVVYQGHEYRSPTSLPVLLG